MFWLVQQTLIFPLMSSTTLAAVMSSQLRLRCSAQRSSGRTTNPPGSAMLKPCQPR